MRKTNNNHKTNNNNNNNNNSNNHYNKINRNININHKNHSRSFPFTNSYYISILFRFIVGTLAIGYIHPDEYFQSPEITSSFIFNYKTFKPWEFSDNYPCRSIVIPLFNSGIPFYILKSIQNLIDFIVGSGNSISIINGSTLIFAPRFFMVCLSFLLDYYMVVICKRFNLSYRKALSILSSCWLVTIFHSRTFSNTIESLLVATLLTLIVTYRDSESGLVKIGIFRDWLIGFTIACGIFSRFTFVFFAAPMGVYLFYLYLTRSKSIITTIICIITIIIGFFSTSLFFILVDSIYFKYLDIPFFLQDPIDIIYQFLNFIKSPTLLQDSKQSINSLLLDDSFNLFSFIRKNLTYTPINSLIYNMDPRNLAEHGINNRLTHIFANLPMMIGPLIILLIVEIFNINSSSSGSGGNNSSNNSGIKDSSSNNNNFIASNNHHKNSGTSSNRKEVFPRSIRNLLLSVVLSGIIFLSMAPHQEARFLLPIFFPLALLTYRYFYFNKKRSKILLIIWIVFNMFLTIFFGFIHQAGITPSLAFLNSNIIKQHNSNNSFNNNLIINNNQIENNNSNNIINNNNNNIINNNIINSSSNNISIIYYHTYMPPRYILGINKNNDKVNVYDILGANISSLVNLVESLKNSKVYILSPTKTILYQQYKGKTCQLTESFWPHLTTEDMPSRLDELRLFMFECIDI